MNAWSEQDSIAARADGWDLFEFWEGHWQYEIERDVESNIFSTNEAAHDYVRVFTASNALCRKAWSIVFNSKLAPTKGVKRARTN